MSLLVCKCLASSWNTYHDQYRALAVLTDILYTTETYGLLEESKHPDCLEEFIQIVMESRHLLRSIDVGI